MIFGKNQDEFDFEAFRGDLNTAAEPLVEAVSKYDPNKKKSRRYKSPTADLPGSASLFFSAAADTLDKQSHKAEHNTDKDAKSGDKVKGLNFDKTAKDLGKTATDVRDEAAKRGSWLLGAAGDTAGKAGDSIKDVKLDKKFGKVVDNVNGTVKDAKLDKKFGKLVDNVGSSVKDAKLDKKFGKVVDNVAGSVKDAKLDQKAGGVVEAVGGVLLGAAASVGDTVKNAASSVGDSVKDAKFDQKLSNVSDSVATSFKDAKLDKKVATAADNAGTFASNVAETAGAMASNVAEAVGDFIKDNKLDKKAADMADSATTFLSAASDKAGQTIKDAKFDKKLADAEIPEKLFAAANIIPGVTVKNPKKSAKQFRKSRAEALKAASQQQRDLSKVLAARGKDAQKYIKARQKDIETGKIRVPFVEPKKKSNLLGRTALISGGVGLAYGGLAANNKRIWDATAPLESQLSGESHFYRSRQGLVFYKEAGESREGQPPVVFVHGVGAGNTSYEWRENFGPISQGFKSYAYDLLGFGNSDRPNFKYTAEVYIKQLTEFLDEVVKQPAYIVASSLSGAYAVQVAFRRPELIQKLVLVSPTGINKQAGKSTVAILPTFTYFILRSPVLGKAIYSYVSSKAGIRSFMEQQMFYDKSLVRDEMVQQYHTAAHQQGAEYAPPSFFTGLLDAEIGETIAKIAKPILMVFGTDSRITPTEEAQALHRKNPLTRLEILDRARLSVNWERAEEVNRLALDFLNQDIQVQPANIKPSDTAGVGLGQTGPERKNVEPKPTKSAEKIEAKVEEIADKVQDKIGQATDKLKGKAEDVKDDLSDVASEAQRSQSQARRAQAQMSSPATAPEAAVEPEYQGDHDLAKELREHREAFIGDNESGAALLEDKDRNNLDDRRMGPLG